MGEGPQLVSDGVKVIYVALANSMCTGCQGEPLKDKRVIGRSYTTVTISKASNEDSICAASVTKTGKRRFFWHL